MSGQHLALCVARYQPPRLITHVRRTPLFGGRALSVLRAHTHYLPNIARFILPLPCHVYVTLYIFGTPCSCVYSPSLRLLVPYVCYCMARLSDALERARTHVPKYVILETIDVDIIAALARSLYYASRRILLALRTHFTCSVLSRRLTRYRHGRLHTASLLALSCDHTHAAMSCRALVGTICAPRAFSIVVDVSRLDHGRRCTLHC